MPRIGIDVTAALTQGGGIGRYTRELVRALAVAQKGASYDTPRFSLFSARPPARMPVPDPLPTGADFTFLPAPVSEKWLYRLWYRLRLPIPVQLVTGPLDLFHSPDFVLPPTSGNIPTLLTVHDLSFVHFPDTFPKALVDYLNSVVPWSVERATHVVADSQATKDDLVQLWGVAEKKVTVLYSGVSRTYRPDIDVAATQRVRERYGLEKRPYLLTVGTVQPRKNYQMLIRAFAAAAGDLPYDLAIAGGRGWLDDQMLNEAHKQGINDRVRFLGFVADEDLPALYSGATLFLFPSLYEGFGLPVLEAMACGVPVIMSNSSSLPEVGGNAVLPLPPDATDAWTGAISTLLRDTELRAQLQEAGLQRVRDFSWQKSAEVLLELYAALLDKGATSRHN